MGVQSRIPRPRPVRYDICSSLYKMLTAKMKTTGFFLSLFQLKPADVFPKSLPVQISRDAGIENSAKDTTLQQFSQITHGVAVSGLQTHGTIQPPLTLITQYHVESSLQNMPKPLPKGLFRLLLLARPSTVLTPRTMARAPVRLFKDGRWSALEMPHT